MRDGPSLAALALCAACLVLAVAPPGRATVRFQEQAVELGYPAQDCGYCHTFTKEHMTRHAREAGLRSTNCVTCHAASLPLEGVDLYNPRGRYLLEQKKVRKAKRCEMRWLEDYVEEDPAEGEAEEASPRKPPHP